jgi:peptide/nickel transport system permease protein
MFWAGIKEMGGWSFIQYVFQFMSWAKLVNIAAARVWPVVVIARPGGISRNFRVMRGNLLDVLTARYVSTYRNWVPLPIDRLIKVVNMCTTNYM